MTPTKAQFRRFTRGFVRPLGDKLGLRDWSFDVRRSDEEQSRHPGEQVIATCHPYYGRKVAEITLHPLFFELAPDRQRHALIHEMVHCHLAAVQNQVEEDLKEHFSDSAYSVFFDSFRRNLEYAIDGIAETFAELATQIPEPSFD